MARIGALGNNYKAFMTVLRILLAYQGADWGVKMHGSVDSVGFDKQTYVSILYHEWMGDTRNASIEIATFGAARFFHDNDTEKKRFTGFQQRWPTTKLAELESLLKALDDIESGIPVQPGKWGANKAGTANQLAIKRAATTTVPSTTTHHQQQDLHLASPTAVIRVL